MALVFQSSCMADGAMEFLTMLRGCVKQGAPLDDHSLFAAFVSNRHIGHMNTLVSKIEWLPYDTAEIQLGEESLAKLGPLCKSAVERKVHRLLNVVIHNTYTDPIVGKVFGSRFASDTELICLQHIRHLLNCTMSCEPA